MAFYSRGRRPLAEEEKSTDAAKARTRAMELLAGQELSSGQLYERLNRRYTQQTSAAVVAEMVQREYINDARYAETRAHALLAAKKSRRAAAQNLRQKGLAAGEIQQALDAVYTPDVSGEDPERNGLSLSGSCCNGSRGRGYHHPWRGRILAGWYTEYTDSNEKEPDLCGRWCR